MLPINKIHAYLELFRTWNKDASNILENKVKEDLLKQEIDELSTQVAQSQQNISNIQETANRLSSGINFVEETTSTVEKAFKVLSGKDKKKVLKTAGKHGFKEFKKRILGEKGTKIINSKDLDVVRNAMKVIDGKCDEMEASEIPFDKEKYEF